MWRHRIVGVLLLGALTFALPAGAAPYFARKYQTSCQTCHVAQPKLNDFGIAFRNNGYEWPGGEEEMTKQKPVVLSAEANKEAFPDAVWPSWLPDSLPLSLIISGQLGISDKKYPNWVSPAGLGTGFSIAAAGAIAAGISMNAIAGVSATAGSSSATVRVPQAFVRFRLLKKERLSLRAGRFTPDLYSFPTESLLGSYWVYSRSVGKTTWSPGGRQGVELQSIVLDGRVRASAGASGSTGELGKSWDGWAHVSTKLGGLRLDGIDEGQDGAASPTDAMHPWRDNSLQVGLSVYNGQSTYAASSSATARDVFTHYGVDLDLWLGDANLIAAFVTGRHSQLVPGQTPAWIHTVDASVDYVVYPWLVPSLLFEWSDDGRFSPYSTSTPEWHVVGSTSVLIVANVRAYANFELGPYSDTPQGETSLNFLGANLGVSLGF